MCTNNFNASQVTTQDPNEKKLYKIILSQPDKPLVKQALALHSLGFNPLACKQGKKIPFHWWKDYQFNRESNEDVIKHFRDSRAYHIGLICGFNNLRCFDFDKCTSFKPVEIALDILGLDSNYPWLEKSLSGKGYHIWFLSEGGIPEGLTGAKPTGTSPDGLFKQLELRWQKDQTVITLPDHDTLPVWVSPHQVKNAFLAVAVQAKRGRPTTDKSKHVSYAEYGGFKAIGTPYGMKALEGEINALKGASNGTRNETLNACAFSLGQLIGGKELQEDPTRERLTQTALEIGLEMTETESTIQSGIESGKLQPRTAPKEKHNLTDAGNVDRLVDKHGDTLRYCRKWGQWLANDGIRWESDREEVAYGKSLETARMILHEAETVNDKAERLALVKHSFQSENANRIRAMLELAKRDERIVISQDKFDVNPWLLNVQNVTIDLKNGALQPHDRQDFITKLSPVMYDPGAKCPLWLAFLDRILESKTALIEYVQKSVGYSLTGLTNEQCLFIMYGTGANGKSTFIEVLSSLMNDYAQVTDMRSFLLKDSEGARNDLAKLASARLVTAVEVRDGKRLDETLIKQVTGGDRITARFLFKEEFTFTPQFKIWLAVNHKPVIKNTDHAIWRRIRLIPFNVTIPDKEMDRELAEKLKGELPGILNWAIQGCLWWKRDGLEAPSEVINATSEYKGESDILQAWIDECCVVKPECQSPASFLYINFQEWCNQNGENMPLNQKQFGIKLNEKGFIRARIPGGLGNKYIGIGLPSA